MVVAGSQWVRAVAGERKMQRLPLSIALGSLCLLLSVAEVVVGGGEAASPEVEREEVGRRWWWGVSLWFGRKKWGRAVGEPQIWF